MIDEKKQIHIANLPAADVSAPGTMSAEELSKILARARAETAQTVATVGEEERQQAERGAAERDELEQWRSEQQQIRAIDADTAARRGQANATLGRSACITGGATVAGFLIGGPPGAVIGCVVGWIGNHLLGGN